MEQPTDIIEKFFLVKSLHHIFRDIMERSNGFGE